MPAHRHRPPPWHGARNLRRTRAPPPARTGAQAIKSTAMTDSTGTAVVVCALVMAVWCLVRAARDQALGRAELIGLVVVEVAVLVHVGASIARAAGGASAAEPVPFVGYLVTIALIVPAGLVLAKLEPTRWGSVIAGVACLVDPVLVLRLNQVWHG